MKKEVVKTTIAVHPVQAALIRGLQSGKINLQKDSLREIAKKCGVENPSAQQMQHHINYLVRLGVINIIRGEHVYTK